MANFLVSVLIMAVPLLLCSLGALFSEKAGVINIGLEGLMLTGALFGVLGSYWTGSPYIGALLAMLAGLLLSLLFAFFTITIRANQIVVGVALNIVASGLTISLNRVFLTSSGVLKVADFETLPIPLLSRIPLLGETLFSQSLLGYAAYALVFATWFILGRTNLGLKIRAVGDHPTACDTVGIHVNRLRYETVLFSGMMAGLAGACISTDQLNAFSEGMISGRGFIAYAAVIFGNFTPLGVFRSCLIFATGMGLQYRLQAMDTPVSYYFWMMLPYIITVVALCAYHKRSNAPRFSGLAYAKN
ncbi:MAG: inner-rane translocator [Paenibacillaceae bacterium]|jgi:simple sugar transport system permease protein|nr:inner-rane translocator [Paenibacillaceae bacterium]